MPPRAHQFNGWNGNQRNQRQRFRVTPRRIDRACRLNSLSSQVKRMEESWKKLHSMYEILQDEYSSMRTGNVAMAVLTRRLQSDIVAFEERFDSLRSERAELKCKVKKLEEKLASHEANSKEMAESKLDLHSYNLAKDARIAAIRSAVISIKSGLGGWGHNLSEDEITELFKELDELL